jgi:hypothetical protein
MRRESPIRAAMLSRSLERRTTRSATVAIIGAVSASQGLELFATAIDAVIVTRVQATSSRQTNGRGDGVCPGVRILQ